ncbi:hypothetical protein GCM10023185_12830 [Hymenobacter saemangeumensis]|uniref:DUF4239 domain-containing protein n=1 Tax=Hymenobacter saemangeumensis TaxID=1084522 RepID=A0ABP8I7B3_9BACT
MDGLVSVMVWLGLSGLGLGLGLLAGRLVKVLSRRHQDRSQLGLARALLAGLLGWAALATALAFVHSAWYLASAVAATACFYGTVLRHPVQEDEERLLEKEQRKALARYEQLVQPYEQLLQRRQAEGLAFLDEALLPAPKARLAQALRQVYWARLNSLHPALSRAELLKQYAALAYFIKAEDAVFMNRFNGVLQPGEEAVRLARQDPEYFIMGRERMNKVYQRLSEEQNQLMNEWYKAGAVLDED